MRTATAAKLLIWACAGFARAIQEPLKADALNSLDVITPETVIESEKVSIPLVNPSGTLALYTKQGYSFDRHSAYSHLYCLNVSAKSSIKIADGIDEFAWASDSSILFLNGTPSTLYTLSIIDPRDPVELRHFNGSLSQMQSFVSGDSVHVIAYGKSDLSGNLINPNDASPYSSGLVFDRLYARYWDVVVNQTQKNQVFMLELVISEPSVSLKTDLINPLAPYNIELYEENSLVADMGPDFFAVVARSSYDMSRNTTSYVYIVPYNGSKPLSFGIDHLGSSASPSIGPDNLVSYIRRSNPLYESGQTAVMLWDVVKNETWQILREWDRPTVSLSWHTDTLLLIGEDRGTQALYSADPYDTTSDKPNEIVAGNFSVSSVTAYSQGLLYRATSFFESEYIGYLVPSKDLTYKDELLILPAVSTKPRFDSFWFHGSRRILNHAYLVHPSGFDKTKKYPLIMLIHGGPESAWHNEWSRRWNPAAFADSLNAVVLLVNPTGSTGYGQAFTQSIKNNWGSLPYVDLVLGLKHAVRVYDYIDESRAAIAGASFGGYMANWIQGNDLGRAVNAIVCHDGITSLSNVMATDQLYFPLWEFGGTPWDQEIDNSYFIYDPLRLVHNWATPQMVIHSSLDYRIPVSEGFMAFNALQMRQVPSKLLYFPDECHWVLKPENSLKWHREVLGFLKPYLSHSDAAKLRVSDVHNDYQLEDMEDYSVLFKSAAIA
ncbi:hypothetical protein CANCADRAFT_46053 [Tortispora caseinolytica NRRL Y-17796]|uniref:Dipeptidyl-peptidase V n=1 Tax=Tortispora caseinolytica NRRL Y-17796 TaxID=767744 RepID=A0A1E4TDA7_9ASCO|nr:hypothetical protein CANCADRAFT_46053 [Tortispora caseinolytica NRRL Y-17796]